MMNKKEYIYNIALNLILLFIFLLFFSFLHVLYEIKTNQIYVSSREEYTTNDNNYKLVVEKISEFTIPFSLDDLRFVVGKKVDNDWIYKNAFVIPFEYSIHHGIKYTITWIDGGVIIKTIAEKPRYSRIYRIYFEDIF